MHLRRVARLREDSGLVLVVWGWFQACSWSWTCAQLCSGMHDCVIAQLLNELKPIVSIFESQLSCNSAMDKPHSVPHGLSWAMAGPHIVIRLRPSSSFPSVEDLFGPGSDPKEIIHYPRYDEEPYVQCPKCRSKVMLSRIPFQNGCTFCKDMGLNMCECICSLCF